MTDIATKIDDADFPLKDDWRGDASLYRVTPGLPYADGVTDYVVASSITLADSYRDSTSGGFLQMWDIAAGIDRSEETMIFPTTSSGTVLDWAELAMVAAKDHAEAFETLGYTIEEAE